MSPQATLVEFIATSASFHGVRRQTLQALEDELFRVFRNNIMPANAAAWYMAKRRFYNKGPQNELLAMLLKEYPKKFAITNNVVQFLESYTPAVSLNKGNFLNFSQFEFLIIFYRLLELKWGIWLNKDCMPTFPTRLMNMGCISSIPCITSKLNLSMLIWESSPTLSATQVTSWFPTTSGFSRRSFTTK